MKRDFYHQKYRKASAVLAPMGGPTADDYSAACDKMLAAVISDAIKHHWVSVDADGENLIAALCASLPPHQEPSVLMVRAVIEVAFG